MPGTCKLFSSFCPCDHPVRNHSGHCLHGHETHDEVSRPSLSLFPAVLTTSRIKSVVNYIPSVVPSPSSLERQMAYTHGSHLSPPYSDSQGWVQLPSVDIQGKYAASSGVEDVTVTYKLYVAIPVSRHPFPLARNFLISIPSSSLSMFEEHPFHVTLKYPPNPRKLLVLWQTQRHLAYDLHAL